MIFEQIFFNLSPDLFCLVGTDGYFKKVNPAFETMLGFTAEEILREVFINFVHPDDRITTIHELEKLQIGTAKTSFENRFRCQDGSYRWLSWTIHSALSEDVLYAIGRDITDKRQKEETLHDIRTRLEAALNAGAIATWTFDLINNRVVADQNLERLFCVSPEEAAGGSLESYVRAIHPDDCQEVNEKIQAAIARRSDYEAEYRIVQRDGSVRWVIARGRVECDRTGNPVSLPGVVLDITERKKIEKALSESERRFRFLAQQGPSYLWLTDAEGQLLSKKWV